MSRVGLNKIQSVDDKSTVEIKLSQIDDPIGYVLKVLKKQASVLEHIQTSPRSSVATIYVDNASDIDECHRDVNVAWNRLRETVIGAGNAKEDKKHEHDRVIQAVTHGVVTCQKVFDMFDRFCDQYGIPDNDPHLFAKIGTIIQP